MKTLKSERRERERQRRLAATSATLAGQYQRGAVTRRYQGQKKAK